MSREEAREEACRHLDSAIQTFEKREGPNWLLETNLHLIRALKLGMNDGEAAERLAINLEQHGQPSQAIELCEIVLSADFLPSKCRFQVGRGHRNHPGQPPLLGSRLRKFARLSPGQVN